MISKFRNFLWGGILLLAALTSVSAQTLDANAKGRIEFQSFTPKTMFDLAHERRQNWANQTAWGDLSFPPHASGKVPAMVLIHGSGGVGPNMEQWVDAFNEMGVATFVVHVFDARGVKRTVEDQTLVPYAADMMDAFQALQVLATHPGIDSHRIGIMGFGRGGSVAFQTALEPLRKAVIKSDLKFALHIPMYAACNQVFWSPNISSAPILNLVGAEDDYGTAAPCEALAAKYKAAGANVKTIKYDGAGDSWDAIYKVFYLPNATRSAPCGIVRTDIDTWTVTAELTNSVIPRDRLSEFYKGCVTRGAHTGRNELAFRRSRSDVQTFAQTILFATSLASANMQPTSLPAVATSTKQPEQAGMTPGSKPADKDYVESQRATRTIPDDETQARVNKVKEAKTNSEVRIVASEVSPVAPVTQAAAPSNPQLEQQIALPTAESKASNAAANASSPTEALSLEPQNPPASAVDHAPGVSSNSNSSDSGWRQRLQALLERVFTLAIPPYLAICTFFGFKLIAPAMSRWRRSNMYFVSGTGYADVFIKQIWMRICWEAFVLFCSMIVGSFGGAIWYVLFHRKSGRTATPT